jgi:tRNA threonylcarbamoyladenosine biosynthesis protein TsaB
MCGETLLESRRAPVGPTAETLLPTIDALLGSTGVGLDALDGFAVSAGPGSFTSLRVGVATVKGLAFGGRQPVAAVSTLAALARVAFDPDPGGETRVVPMLDARRGEIYAAVYEHEAGQVRECVAEGVYTPDDLCRLVTAPCVVVGEGAGIGAQRLVECLGPEVAVVPPPLGEAHARHVGLLGTRQLAAGQAVSADALVPRYVRRAEAEVQRTGERFEPRRLKNL